MIELLIGILIALASTEAQPQAEPEPISACEWAESASVVWGDFNRGYYDSGLYDWYKSDGADRLGSAEGRTEYANIVSTYIAYIVTFGDEWEALGGQGDVSEIWFDGLDAAQMKANGMALMRQGVLDMNVGILDAGIAEFKRGDKAEDEMLDGLNSLQDECRQSDDTST